MFQLIFYMNEKEMKTNQLQYNHKVSFKIMNIWYTYIETVVDNGYTFLFYFIEHNW